MKEVLIAGGGIIGLMSAYYLERAGHKVTIVDKHNFLTNCSAGNAGFIVPSHYVPLAAPGMVWKALKWSLNNKSPFSVQINLQKERLKWGLEFIKASTVKNVKNAAPFLFEFNNYSKSLYKELSQNKGLQLEYKESGLLLLCRSQKVFLEEMKIANEANKLGIKAIILNQNEVNEFSDGIEFDVCGAVYYPGDASISNNTFVIGLMKYLEEKNINLIKNSELTNFSIKAGRIVKAGNINEQYKFDELVICTGYQSQKIFKKLNIKTLVQPGKGYSFIHPAPLQVKTPLILVDARVAISPYDNYTRFGGYMAIGDSENKIKNKRIQGMVESINKFIPEIELKEPNENKIWSGMRPCSVDGLPYIGRVKSYKNVIVATGHSMMGVSMAPATGKIIEELISEKPLSYDIAPFDPER